MAAPPPPLPTGRIRIECGGDTHFVCILTLPPPPKKKSEIFLTHSKASWRCLGFWRFWIYCFFIGYLDRNTSFINYQKKNLYKTCISSTPPWIRMEEVADGHSDSHVCACRAQGRLPELLCTYISLTGPILRPKARFRSLGACLPSYFCNDNTELHNEISQIMTFDICWPISYS